MKLQVILVCLSVSLLIGFRESRAQAPSQRLTIHVQETDGIRRFGYPVTIPVELPAGALSETRNARLVRADGKPLAAQLTAVLRHPDGSIQRLEADLTLSPGPLETIPLTLEYGGATSAVEPRQGLTFSETDEAFQVSAYRIRKDARPLIAAVRYGRDYVREGGMNVVAWRDGVAASLHDASRNWTVVKRGPVQVRLRCEGHHPGQRGAPDLPYTLTLEFCSSKSWVGIDYAVGPASGVTTPLALAVTAELAVTGRIRMLWDVDVGYWLYGVLESADRMVFASTAAGWTCRSGGAGEEALYATSTPAASRFLGWGHFQEAREGGNVVAFGLASDSSPGESSLQCDGQGRLQVMLRSAQPGHTRLRSCYHFIPVPAQHTAATSPASMMQPLRVVLPSG